MLGAGGGEDRKTGRSLPVSNAGRSRGVQDGRRGRELWAQLETRGLGATSGWNSPRSLGSVDGGPRARAVTEAVRPQEISERRGPQPSPGLRTGVERRTDR